MARTLCTYGEHDWDWREDIDAWECACCYARVIGNAHIEPCLTCGADVDAAAVYCDECLSEVSDEAR